MSIFPFALLVGVLGDYLLRAPGEPGLNIALIAATGTLSVVVLRGQRLPAANAVLLAAALLFSFGLAGRDAEALRVLNLFAAMGTALLAAGAGAWMVRSSITEYVRTGAMSVLATLGGALRLLPQSAALGRRRHTVAAFRGVLIALPLLLFFGSLLAAADPVFEQVVSFDIDQALGHVALIAALTWGAAGYLGHSLQATSAPPAPLPLPRPRIGAIESSIVLGLLNALFLLFVVIQARYLFGGADLVEVTPGLTFAEYARRGFFELVAVAALIVPLLLLVDWCAHRETRLEQWLFRGLAYGQVLLLFAILASAYYRMHLYRSAYGLTEDRLFTTWFMAWIAWVIAWFAATVLHGRRHHFTVGALASALVVLLALNITNPHALIARVNAERASFDVAHAASLSGDAVPALLTALDDLPATERCQLANRMLERWTQPPRGDWRNFNYGEWQARAAVSRERSRLEMWRCAETESPTRS